MVKKEDNISKEMLNYIDSQIDKGFSHDDIKMKLKEAGHSYDYVEKHIDHHKRKGLYSKLGIAAIVIAIVLLVILMLTKTRPEQTPTVLMPTLDSASCYQLPKDQQAKCLQEVNYNQAILQKDISKCKDTQDQSSCRDNVVMSIAFFTKDILSCDKIEDKAIKLTCRDNMIISQALSDRKPELCNEVTNEVARQACKDKLK